MIFRLQKYEKSNYKSITGYGYLKVRFNKGFYGDYLTYNMLDKISEKKKILTNVYIPKENGGTTETDVIMLHEKGIFDINLKITAAGFLEVKRVNIGRRLLKKVKRKSSITLYGKSKLI